MPLFYFDVHDGVSGLDRVGMGCFDREAARREAWRRAGTLMIEEETDWFGTGQDWQIGVVDAHNVLLFNVNFRGFAGLSMTTQLSSYCRVGVLSARTETPIGIGTLRRFTPSGRNTTMALPNRLIAGAILPRSDSQVTLVAYWRRSASDWASACGRHGPAPEDSRWVPQQKPALSFQVHKPSTRSGQRQ